jgi:hypothetical protein
MRGSFERGALTLVYERVGTHEGTYDYEGSPCVWMSFVSLFRIVRRVELAFLRNEQDFPFITFSFKID